MRLVNAPPHTPYNPTNNYQVVVVPDTPSAPISKSIAALISWVVTLCFAVFLILCATLNTGTVRIVLCVFLGLLLLLIFYVNRQSYLYTIQWCRGYGSI